MSTRTCDVENKFLWGIVRSALVQFHRKVAWDFDIDYESIYTQQSLQYCFAGSFATHFDLSRPPSDYNAYHNAAPNPSNETIFPYNDIDVFVMGANNSADTDTSVKYEILSSVKLDLKLKTDAQCTCGCYNRFDEEHPLHLNVILVSGCKDLHHLINYFDINCCQIGYVYDFLTSKLVNRTTTSAYDEFLSSRKLKVVNTYTPTRSFCRLLRKRIDLNYPILWTPQFICSLFYNSTGNLVEKHWFERLRDDLQERGEYYFIQDYFQIQYFEDSSHRRRSPRLAALRRQQNNEEYGSSMSFTIKGPRYVLKFRGSPLEKVHKLCMKGNFHLLKEKCQSQGGLHIMYKPDRFGITPIQYFLCSHKRYNVTTVRLFFIMLLQMEEV